MAGNTHYDAVLEKVIRQCFQCPATVIGAAGQVNGYDRGASVGAERDVDENC